MLTYYIKDMPEVEVGVNDITRMGLEVVGRHDILPVPTEQWIRYENIEFHAIDIFEWRNSYWVLTSENILLQINSTECKQTINLSNSMETLYKILALSFVISLTSQ